jgi:plasmid stabilization system protein ParE
MKYRVHIEEAADKDLDAIALWLAQRSERAAGTWYWQVRDAIESLQDAPLRCPLAPENTAFHEEIRHLLHGRGRFVYRILFTVQADTVHVLHVRHGAMSPLTHEED